jgi:hypothetical protein
MYRYISHESCSQFDSLPLTYLTYPNPKTVDAPSDRGASLVWIPTLDFEVAAGDRARGELGAGGGGSCDGAPLQPRARAEGAPLPDSRCVRARIDRLVGSESGRKTALECDATAAAFVPLPLAKAAPGLLFSSALLHAAALQRITGEPRTEDASRWRDAGLGAPRRPGAPASFASVSTRARGARTPPGLDRSVRSAVVRNVSNAPLATDPRRTRGAPRGSQQALRRSGDASLKRAAPGAIQRGECSFIYRYILRESR